MVNQFAVATDAPKWLERFYFTTNQIFAGHKCVNDKKLWLLVFYRGEGKWIIVRW